MLQSKFEPLNLLISEILTRLFLNTTAAQLTYYDRSFLRLEKYWNNYCGKFTKQNDPCIKVMSDAILILAPKYRDENNV